ncbi:MAG: hypothetical protein CME06_14715 [Gemmatimonadetes bacterium]|nr:hypothetical protein [Gemmatimonadota bacterium]
MGRIPGVGLLLAASMLLPSAAGAASIFSLNGMGEPIEAADVRALGMGGATIAVGDGRSLSTVNPATARAEELAMLGVELSPGALRTEGPEAELSTESFGFEMARLLFPVGETTTLALGLHTEASFDTPRIETTLEQDSLVYRRSTQSTGTISAIGGGLAFDLGAITIGARGDYLFGSAVEDWLLGFEGDTLFHDSSNRPIPIRDQVDRWRTSILGTQFSLGLLWRGKGVDIGVFGTYSPWAEGFQEYEGLASGLESRTHSSYSMPPRAGAGIAWRPFGGVTLAADGELSAWSSFEVDGATLPAMSDVYRLAAGLEWYLGREGTYLSENLPLRVGGALSPLPYRIASQGGGWRRVDVSRLTLGTGLRFAGGRGWADLAFEYIVRDEGTIREREYRFHISLGAMERWARKL